MTDLPTSFPALAGLALVLGARHGLDADHLATIDGLTRLGGAGSSVRRRWCGLLFSLGHGAVVVGVVALLSLLQRQWQVPAWFQATGTAVSLAFLLLLGVANLRALMQTEAGQPVAPVGFKARWLGMALQGRHPLWAAGVGALFALSFDTLSQAALFAVAGQGHGAGWGATWGVVLALLFTTGMLLTDGLNGWWVARLLQSSDARAARASRVMGTAVALLSLGVAALGITRWLLPHVDGWADEQGLAISTVLVVVVAGSYALARLLARRPGHAWA
jgi:high-affinity nickel-transport protein